MKDNAHQIVGKTIIGVIIKKTKHNRPPRSQLFLIFDDHTSYEFYSDAAINPTGGLDKMSFNDVYKYMGEQMKTVFHAVKDPDSGRVAYSAGDNL
jgi:hypothetical protein